MSSDKLVFECVTPFSKKMYLSHEIIALICNFDKIVTFDNMFIKNNQRHNLPHYKIISQAFFEKNIIYNVLIYEFNVHLNSIFICIILRIMIIVSNKTDIVIKV